MPRPSLLSGLRKLGQALADSASVGPERLRRKSGRGVMFGLPLGPAVALLAAGIMVVALLPLSGPRAVFLTSPIWGFMTLSALLPVADRKLVEWVPVAISFGIRSSRGQTRYKRRLLAPRPAGTLALPGGHAPLRLVEDAATAVAYVHDPHGKTLTAIARVTHGQFILLDEVEKAERSEGFARMLSTLARCEGLSRVQILARALPDAGVGVEAYWDARRSLAVSVVAATSYDQLLATSVKSSERHETLVSIRLDLVKNARAIKAYGGGISGACALMRARCNTASNAIQAAQLEVDSWLSKEELALIIRTAYDPLASVSLDRAPAVGRNLATAGPIAVEEHWNYLRTDSAYHQILVIEWPQIPAWPGFLRPLIIRPGVRAAVSLIFEPIDRGKAISQARKEVVAEEITRRERARSGKLETVLDQADQAEASRHLEDVGLGFTDVNYAGLITVSAGSENDLAGGVEEIRAAAVEAGCEVRVMVAQQAALFPAGALPLCDGLDGWRK